MTNTPNHLGLTTTEAKQRQHQYGKNELAPRKKEGFLRKVFHILCEPMFLLLIVAAVIYFILGEPRDGAIMLIFVWALSALTSCRNGKPIKTSTRSKTCPRRTFSSSVTVRNSRSPALIGARRPDDDP
jgi:Ca2+-transporting ATPase